MDAVFGRLLDKLNVVPSSDIYEGGCLLVWKKLIADKEKCFASRFRVNIENEGCVSF